MCTHTALIFSKETIYHLLKSDLEVCPYVNECGHAGPEQYRIDQHPLHTAVRTHMINGNV